MAKKTDGNLKDKLISLGAETLAQVLLELGDQYDPVHKRLERLIETPDEKLRRVKAKIAGLKRGRRFIDWRESSEFAGDLSDLLSDIRACVSDPKTGLKLLEAFYLTDDAVISRCDDSDGLVGDVYKSDAKELFEEYGKLCTDKALVSDLIFRLSLSNEYGVRDTLIESTGAILDKEQIRLLIDRYMEYSDRALKDSDKREALRAVISLAEQIGDAALFEQTWLIMAEKPWPKLWVDIARQYLHAGDADTAYDRLRRVPDDDALAGDGKNKLLLEIYRHQGLEEKRTELLDRMFRSNHSVTILNSILESVGEDHRGELIEAAVGDIKRRVGLSYTDLRFLLDCGLHREAESYLLSRADRIDGDMYSYWLPFAEEMEKDGLVTGASLAYRALLLSILEKANTRAHSHAARYLKKLDRLAKASGDWISIGEHRLFKEKLVREHGRKASFWAKYEEAK
jgi:hypothetical protein